jgi:type II secretion system protein H
MKNNGFSLVELIVAMVIIGILLSVAVINFNQWMTKSNVEKQANEIYMELAEARELALHTRQPRSVRVSANSLVFRRYTSDADLESGAGVLIKTKTLRYPITPSTWSDPSANPNITAEDILFTTRGIVDQPTPISICVYSTVGPAVDAVVVVQSRVATGKIKVQGGACDLGKIDVK